MLQDLPMHGNILSIINHQICTILFYSIYNLSNDIVKKQMVVPNFFGKPTQTILYLLQHHKRKKIRDSTVH